MSIWKRFGGYMAVVVFTVAIAPVAGRVFSQLDSAAIRFTGFDAALWQARPTILQVHVLAAPGVLFVGAAIFSNQKGSAIHRALGWAWVSLIAVAAGTKLPVTVRSGDMNSLIDLLAGWTLIALPLAVIAVRRHDVLRHRMAMTGLFICGLLVAGTFTFLPGRLIWRLIFKVAPNASLL